MTAKIIAVLCLVAGVANAQTPNQQSLDASNQQMRDEMKKLQVEQEKKQEEFRRNLQRDLDNQPRLPAPTRSR